MQLIVNNHHILLIISVTFFASVILVPIVRILAKHVGAVDIPDERKVHTKITPRLGGIAIFLAFLIGYLFFARMSTQMISILISSFL